jgi:hypothetical protein
MSSPERVIEEDLQDTMAEAGVLERFHQLPEGDQDMFSRWIDKARDDESHWRRINALVLALRIGPFEASMSP